MMPTKASPTILEASGTRNLTGVRISDQSGSPNLAREISAPSSAGSTEPAGLRFGIGKLRTPRSRDDAAFSRTGSRISGRASATADSMAVEGVGGELVSAGDSLICRDNTGKLATFDPTGTPHRST